MPAVIEEIEVDVQPDVRKKRPLVEPQGRVVRAQAVQVGCVTRALVNLKIIAEAREQLRCRAVPAILFGDAQRQNVGQFAVPHRVGEQALLVALGVRNDIRADDSDHCLLPAVDRLLEPFSLGVVDYEGCHREVRFVPGAIDKLVIEAVLIAHWEPLPVEPLHHRPVRWPQRPEDRCRRRSHATAAAAELPSPEGKAERSPGVPPHCACCSPLRRTERHRLAPAALAARLIVLTSFSSGCPPWVSALRHAELPGNPALRVAAGP